MEALKKGERYTYEDYLTWDDDKRYELIDGVPYLMSPAPSRTHQEISRNLIALLFDFLKDKPCELFHAPFDVRLNIENDDTVVQPDLLIVCDTSKLDERGCKGAPDMIIEILSPSTSSRDLVLKFNKYLQSGVREYWIVDPESRTVSVHILQNGNYVTDAYADTDTAPVHVLEGCRVNLSEVFPKI